MPIGPDVRHTAIGDTHATHMIRDKHSLRTDEIQRSAWEFKFGLHAGRRTTFTPASASTVRNARVYGGSRSRMTYRVCFRKPSTQSVVVRLADCSAGPWVHFTPTARKRRAHRSQSRPKANSIASNGSARMMASPSNVSTTTQR